MFTATALLAILNLGFIGLLPIVFFRRDGSLNLSWCATAAPFFFSAGVLALGLAGLLSAQIDSASTAAAIMQTGAIAVASVSIALMSLTVGVHRVPLALWHQQNDAPVEIVTWGPYARIRHPFYSSFLLALFGAVLVLPHVLTVASLLYAGIALSLTARGEERRLLASELGAGYRDYCRHTGRFLPRLGANHD